MCQRSRRCRDRDRVSSGRRAWLPTATGPTGGQAATGGQEDQARKHQAPQHDTPEPFLACGERCSQHRQAANRQPHRIEGNPRRRRQGRMRPGRADGQRRRA
jgi:hypothetical protein